MEAALPPSFDSLWDFVIAIAFERASWVDVSWPLDLSHEPGQITSQGCAEDRSQGADTRNARKHR